MEASKIRRRPTAEMKWYIALELAGAVYLLYHLPTSQPPWQPLMGAAVALLLVAAIATWRCSRWCPHLFVAILLIVVGHSLYFAFQSGLTTRRVIVWALFVPSAVLGFRNLRKALQTVANRAAGIDDSQPGEPTDIFTLLQRVEADRPLPSDDEQVDQQIDER